MRELDVTQKVPAGWRATVAREAASAGVEEVCLVDRLSAGRASPHASTADSLPACQPVGQFLSACLPAWYAGRQYSTAHRKAGGAPQKLEAMNTMSWKAAAPL